MSELPLAYKTLRNSVYLFLGFIIPMFFTVFVIRQLSGKLGTGEFGVYLFVNAISAFVGFVDLGLGSAITKYVAEYQSLGEKQSLIDLLSSARLLFFIIGFFGLIVFLVIGRWFLPFFKIPQASLNNMFIVFAFAGLTFFFNSLGTIYTATLVALQRFDIITKISLINLIYTSLGVIFLLQIGFQLKMVMAWNAVMMLLLVLTYRYFSNKLMPQLTLKYVFVKSEIFKAYKFGLLIFVSNLSSYCLVYFDRLLIPGFLGPSQLAYYSVPGNVALKTPGVTNSLAGMLFPMASAMSGSGDMEKLKNVYIKAFRNLPVVAAAVTVSVVLFANKILFFWVGKEYSERGTNILIILAVTYYIISLYQPLQAILQGIGKLKFLITQSVTMAIINLILLLLLVPKFGIQGAAWAYFISVLPMFYAFYWVEKKVFKLNGLFIYYLKLYFKLFITTILNGLLIYYLINPLVNSVWRLILLGPLSVLIYGVIYYLIGFMNPEDKLIFKDFLVKFYSLKFN